MKRPYLLNLVKSFGDETALYEATFPKTTTIQDIVEYALEQGYTATIRLAGILVYSCEGGTAKYDTLPNVSRNTYIVKEMMVHGGYRVWTYDIKKTEAPIVNNREESYMNGYSAGAKEADRAMYLQGYIDGRIAAEKEFAEKFGVVIPPKSPRK